MKKMPTIFQRGPDGLIRDEITPGCEWVIAGEGTATLKWDGTCCMIKNGLFYKRYDAKHGKTPPEGFIEAQEADKVTGHWPGWVRVSDTAKEDIYHREGLRRTIMKNGSLKDGTYELIGPLIQNNKYDLCQHRLVKHGNPTLLEIQMYVGLQDIWPPNFDKLKKFFNDINPTNLKARMEGIVWHHPDGRMAKIKARDFGVKW